MVNINITGIVSLRKEFYSSLNKEECQSVYLIDLQNNKKGQIDDKLDHWLNLDIKKTKMGKKEVKRINF